MQNSFDFITKEIATAPENHLLYFLLPRRTGKSTYIADHVGQDHLILSGIGSFNMPAMYGKKFQYFNSIIKTTSPYRVLWVDELFCLSFERQMAILKNESFKNIICFGTAMQFYYKPYFMADYFLERFDYCKVYTVKDIPNCSIYSFSILEAYETMEPEFFAREILGKVWVQ